MSHRHVERCDCGAVLSDDIEREEGVCLTCAIRGELGGLVEAIGPAPLDRLCHDCGEVVDAPEDLEGGCCARCASVARGQRAALDMRLEDRRLRECYGVDAGLARDDERQQQGRRG